MASSPAVAGEADHLLVRRRPARRSNAGPRRSPPPRPRSTTTAAAATSTGHVRPAGCTSRSQLVDRDRGRRGATSWVAGWFARCRISFACRGSTGVGFEREPQAAGRLAELVRQPAAFLAVAVRRELAFQPRHVVAVQPAERPDGQELLDHGVVAVHGSSWTRAARRRRMPRSVRDFTVPSGRPVASAIWLCDIPSKYIRSNTSRCASGSSSKAARTRRRSSGSPICSTTSSA